MSSILHAETSDPMAEPGLDVPQAGIPVAGAAPLHRSAAAMTVLSTSSGMPLPGQPLPESSAQVLGTNWSLDEP